MPLVGMFKIKLGLKGSNHVYLWDHIKTNKQSRQHQIIHSTIHTFIQAPSYCIYEVNQANIQIQNHAVTQLKVKELN